MLEPKKPGEVGGDPTDPAQQQDKQVDSQDMNLEEGDGGSREPQPPAA
jgi:hypothetical protein